MSVNTQRQDYRERVDSEQTYITPAQRNNYESISSSNLSESREWDPESGTMSRGRRTFCLLTAFDLILTFILWVIYTQLIGVRPVWKAFNDQVGNYTFEKSLFDTVMIATVRFTFIMLGYALFRIRHWWVIAITTSMTCVYLLVKCFLFEFNDNLLGGKNPLSYVLLIICFVLAWVETWMLDFKVIPSEKKMLRDIRAHHRNSERDPLLRHNDTNSNAASIEETREYYSPFQTPEGSEDESEQSHSHHAHHGHHGHHKTHSRKDTENYIQILAEAKLSFMELFEMDGWKHETGKNLDEGIVYSQNIKKFGRKIFKLRGTVGMPPGELWEDMVHNLNDSPKWNPTILESRTLVVVDDNTEIMYNISAESAVGLVSARDFTSIRRWTKENDNMYIVVSCSCPTTEMPPNKKYVRGDNGPGGWVFEPIENEPNKCLFTWLVNTNLKGWLPQTAIDQAMSRVLSSYFTLLLGHYDEVIQARQQQQNS